MFPLLSHLFKHPSQSHCLFFATHASDLLLVFGVVEFLARLRAWASSCGLCILLVFGRIVGAVVGVVVLRGPLQQSVYIRRASFRGAFAGKAWVLSEGGKKRARGRVLGLGVI